VDYALTPGRLEFVHLIAERPATTHSIYLGLLAELGIVGITLFVLAVYLALLAARDAGRLFATEGDTQWSTLARTLIVATISLLAAGLFLSSERDYRLWTLLAMGPLLLLSARQRAEHRSS
jgi:O-antigen ligase